MIGPLTMLAVTGFAGRMLGARRGLLALMISGAVGFAFGVWAAGELTDWRWASLDMILATIVLSTLFTMSVAVALDMVAPVGSLARGDRAGRLTLSNPVTTWRRRVEPFRRYRQVVAIARTHGVGLHTMSDASLREAVRLTLEDAGGIFVKLGQVASTRSDVLPPAWCEELSRLRTTAAPAPESEMRPQLTEALGAPPDELYADFDWTPIASASVSQIYRATLRDGSPVIVKAQRPGLDQTIELDGAAIMQLAQLIEDHTALGLRVQPAALAAEFIEGVTEELDFRAEATNAVELGQALAPFPRIRIPTVYAALSGQRVMTQEFITGDTLDVWAAGIADGTRRAALANRLIEVFLFQIFDVGVFHADPHPGNILVERGDDIVLIDLGAVGRLGPGHRAAMLDMLTAASTGSATALRNAIGNITVLDRRLDVTELDNAIEQYLARHMRSGKGINASALQDLLELVGDFGIRLPRWFGTLVRTLVTLEGTLLLVDPQFSLVDAARRHSSTVIGERSISGLRHAVEAQLTEQLPRLARLPQHLDELLGQATEGRLSARVSVLGDERDERVLTRMVDRVVLGIVASATGLTSVFLLGSRAGPEFGDAIALNEVLGYFGLTAAALLVLRLVAGIIRDGEV